MYDAAGYRVLVSSEEAHGDAWVARIRAKHEALGAACPCGNGTDETDEDEGGAA